MIAGQRESIQHGQVTGERRLQFLQRFFNCDLRLMVSALDGGGLSFFLSNSDLSDSQWNRGQQKRSATCGAQWWATN